MASPKREGSVNAPCDRCGQMADDTPPAGRRYGEASPSEETALSAGGLIVRRSIQEIEHYDLWAQSIGSRSGHDDRAASMASSRIEELCI